METISYISSELSLDLQGARIKHEDIQYGGILNILGDGTAFWIISLDNTAESIINQIKGNSEWKALPLSDILEIATYGRDHGTSYSESLVRDDYGDSLFPRTENGYYFFRDRHSKSINPNDDTDLYNRSSFNFTIALFDADTNEIYYFVIDT